MSASENLKSIIDRQQQLLAELESEQKTIEASDLVKENEKLKAEVEKLRAGIKKADEKSDALSDENSRLRNSLYGSIYNEKVKIVEASEEKLDILFRQAEDEETNKLKFLENTVLARIHTFRGTLSQNRIDASDELYGKINELGEFLDRKLTEHRASAAALPGAFSPEERNELAALKAEQITGEQIRKLAEKNNIERFVGLNVLNTVGILLLLIGAITLSRFVYVTLPDTLKGILLFLLGGAMLGGGEFLSRKKPNVFSLGMSAGGIGILYAALVTVYFVFGILNMYAALVLCVLITAGAFLLAVRYDSQVIASFALIGGYLPMLSVSAEAGTVYIAMAYFVILNLFSLLISARRMWRVPEFIGLGLNIISTVYICSLAYSLSPFHARLIAAFYVFFAFLNYTAIPIVRVRAAGKNFKIPDVVLLAVNTFFSSAVMYLAFYIYDWGDLNGLLAIIFAAVYLALGWIVGKRGDDRHVRDLFYLTGLAFVVLVVPLQFGLDWLSLGWLAEGVLVAVYGIVHGRRRMRNAGTVIFGLCLAAFLLADCPRSGRDDLFIFKYLAITLGSIAVLGAFVYKKTAAGIFVTVCKYFTMINLWMFFMYLFLEKLADVFNDMYRGQDPAFNPDYILFTLAVTVTFSLAYFYPRIKMLYTLGVRILSLVLYGAGIFSILLVNLELSPVSYAYLRPGTPSIAVTLLGSLILIALGSLSALALRDIIKTAVTGRKLHIEWYPFILSGYLVIILTQGLIVHYGIPFSSFLISIIYVLTALGWIVLGFVKRYSYIRKFGLGLAVLSVAKLFLIDLYSLTQGFRIVSYFALGAALIAISFLYQYFSKRLEIKEGTFDGKDS